MDWAYRMEERLISGYTRGEQSATTSCYKSGYQHLL